MLISNDTIIIQRAVDEVSSTKPSVWVLHKIFLLGHHRGVLSTENRPQVECVMEATLLLGQIQLGAATLPALPHSLLYSCESRTCTPLIHAKNLGRV